MKIQNRVFHLLFAPVMLVFGILNLGQSVVAADTSNDKPGKQAGVDSVLVNVDNYVRAETAAQFDRMVKMTGGVNKLGHNRLPTPLDKQNVSRSYP